MPVFALAISLFVLSQSAILVRLAEEASAIEIGFWRMFFAVPVLLLIAGLRGQLPQLARLGRKQLLSMFLCGFCLFLHWLIWFISVKTTTLANAMVFFALSPVFTAIGAWKFYREPFTKRHLFALVFCGLGVWLIFREGLGFHSSRLLGDALGLTASILFSAYVLLGKGIRRGLGNLPFTIVTYGSCWVCFLVLLFLKGAPELHYSKVTWLALLALVVGPTLLGHGLFTYCLEHFNVNLMNILVLTEPVLGAISAYWIFGERITAGAAQGFVTVSAAILILFLPKLLKRSFSGSLATRRLDC